MTAPFVTTVTKPAVASRSGWRLRRALLVATALLVVLLALTLLAWVVTPKTGEGRVSWLQRIFRGGQREVDVCTLPPDAGPCRGALPRYYYSPEEGTCKAFLYGGCEGNVNRFASLELCTDRCGGGQTGRTATKTQQDVCALPKVVGECRAALPRYHFHTEQNQCVLFLYGGCGGNANNFETSEACQQRCAAAEGQDRDTQPDHHEPTEHDCTSEPDSGNCMAYFERFAYRPASGACEQFVYGGCGGNGNRFKTKEECETHCHGATAGEKAVEQATPEYDTRLCGVTACPADCGGPVGMEGDCVLCQCGHTPHLQPGELAVADDQPCPAGYAEVRRDFSTIICAGGAGGEPVPEL